MKELIEIQSRLKAPKGQYNSFGKYHYRSAEDILEAVKPLLAEQGCYMTVNDDIVSIGDRFYIKATATIVNGKGITISNTAFAREDDTKKGMDGSQVTGAASSYARKYALNGLFLIDDTKDADTDEYHKQVTKAAPKPSPKKYPPISTDEMMLAEERAFGCTTIKELTDLWNDYKAVNPNYTEEGTVFYNAVRQRKGEIQREQQTQTTLF